MPMDVIESYIIFFVIVFVLFAIYGLVKFIPYFIKKKRHEYELASFYKKNHIINGDLSAIRKVLKDNPDLSKEIEKEYNEQQERDYLYQETKRKEAIAKRVFAYDYEELLYQLFAPIAENNDYFFYWTTSGARESFDKVNLIHRISVLSKKTRSESEQLFNILLEHELIYNWGGVYMLSPMLEYSKGDELLRWDVVSDTDWNLDKWMNANGYKHKNR